LFHYDGQTAIISTEFAAELLLWKPIAFVGHI